MSNIPRNMSELAKTMSVDDGHINAPGVHQSWKSLWVPKTLCNCARNGHDSAEYVSVDDQHISAPWGSTTMEIALGPQNGE